MDCLSIGPTEDDHPFIDIHTCHSSCQCTHSDLARWVCYFSILVQDYCHRYLLTWGLNFQMVHILTPSIFPFSGLLTMSVLDILGTRRACSAHALSVVPSPRQSDFYLCWVFLLDILLEPPNMSLALNCVSDSAVLVVRLAGTSFRFLLLSFHEILLAPLRVQLLLHNLTPGLSFHQYMVFHYNVSLI